PGRSRRPALRRAAHHVSALLVVGTVCARIADGPTTRTVRRSLTRGIGARAVQGAFERLELFGALRTERAVVLHQRAHAGVIDEAVEIGRDQFEKTIAIELFVPRETKHLAKRLVRVRPSAHLALPSAGKTPAAFMSALSK